MAIIAALRHKECEETAAKPKRVYICTDTKYKHKDTHTCTSKVSGMKCIINAPNAEETLIMKRLLLLCEGHYPLSNGWSQDKVACYLCCEYGFNHNQSLSKNLYLHGSCSIYKANITFELFAFTFLRCSNWQAICTFWHIQTQSRSTSESPHAMQFLQLHSSHIWRLFKMQSNLISTNASQCQLISNLKLSFQSHIDDIPSRVMEVQRCWAESCCY